MLPQPTPESAHFWEGTRLQELRLQRCNHCQEHYFPPRPFCPHCHGQDIEVVRASGKATLYSYVISQRPAPGIEAPYVLAVVELEEGPRMMTNIVDCPARPESLPLGMPLEVHFEQQSEEITLPMFRPEVKA
jgi:uncharacterized OB-fold protein